MVRVGFMKVPHKKEYPPLLAAGFHALTLAELKQMCVDNFPLFDNEGGNNEEVGTSHKPTIR